jgi:hypothetical protein
MTPAEKEASDRFERNLDTLHNVVTGWIRVNNKDGVEYFGCIDGIAYSLKGRHGTVDIFQQDGSHKRLNIGDLERITIANPPTETDLSPAKFN